MLLTPDDTASPSAGGGGSCTAALWGVKYFLFFGTRNQFLPFVQRWVGHSLPLVLFYSYCCVSVLSCCVVAQSIKPFRLKLKVVSVGGGFAIAPPLQ